MTTRMVETIDLQQAAEGLSTVAKEKALSYIRFLHFEDATPNAKTIAAIESVLAGNVQHAKTRREFFEAINRDDEND